MWSYEIKSGFLRDPTGVYVSTGYSGEPDAINDPLKTNIPDVGPIPCGVYTIGSPVDTSTHGPYVMGLHPSRNTITFGRSGFLMHGDSIEHPGAASHGCIIMPRSVRERVWMSQDHTLEVV